MVGMAENIHNFVFVFFEILVELVVIFWHFALLEFAAFIRPSRAGAPVVPAVSVKHQSFM